MNKVLVYAGLVLLTGCGGGGGDAPPAQPTSGTSCVPVKTITYATSQPLVDNTSASSYTVLLMGNSHAADIQAPLKQLIELGQPASSVDVQVAPRFAFLANRVDDGVSEETLECSLWTHVVLQGQQYSTTGSVTYPTDAAEYWIRGTKELGATPILFPEHPRKGNTWEGQTLWDLHSGIAGRENACVAPVGLVWDEVVFRRPALDLHEADGNHATETGALLTALVFYQVITGQPVASLPSLSGFGIDAATEQTLKESVASLLFTHAACDYEA